MTTQAEIKLQIGSNFRAEIECAESQTGRTHRAMIRTATSEITTKMDLATGDGITISGTNSKILILAKGAGVTELITCPTDSAIWVYDVESIGGADDRVREAEGSVIVTRDVTRTTESTAAANASKLLTYSLTDGQTLTTEEQELVRDKIGVTSGGGGDITASQITDSTTAGRAILTAADASAQRTALGLGTAATTAASDYATAAQGTDDRTASGLRTASTVVSVSAGAAPSSGQVLTATGSAAATWQTPGGGMAIGWAVTGAVTGSVLFSGAAGALAQDNANLFFDDVNNRLGVGTATPSEALSVNGRVHLAQTTAPAVTADKFYNVGGVPYFGGLYFALQNGQPYFETLQTGVWIDSPAIHTNKVLFSRGTQDIAIERLSSSFLQITNNSTSLISLLVDTLRTQSYTLAALNSAHPSPTIFDRSGITDATTATWTGGATAVGGGSHPAPVWFNGTTWAYGS